MSRSPVRRATEADAWPSGDLALAIAVQELWGRPERPGWDELDAFAARWRPHRAVAARFLWHDYLARRGRGVGVLGSSSDGT